MLQLEKNQPSDSLAFLNLGFRPFFLLAGISSALLMMIWLVIYTMGLKLIPIDLPPMIWHGHEMVFGYAMAVIAGFLLTAVKNWTNIQTLHGFSLLILVVFWIAARLLPFSGLDSALMWMALADLLFMAGLIIAIFIPVFRAKQWSQMPIVLKVGLMFLANLVFYLGLLGYLKQDAINWGLYLGFYLIISLIMMMGRRVIPFFIEKGVDETVTLKNYKWLDISSVFLFLMFVIAEVFVTDKNWASLLALILFVLHTFRLYGWYTHGIWNKSLLWSLYLGYAFIVAGFGLKALSAVFAMSPWLPLHAFAAGGIGIVTLGMMSRVALGHTGRNVFQPPTILGLAFSLALLSAVSRVVLPLFLPQLYVWWILLAQIAWILAFLVFVAVYAPMLIKPRVDGRFG